MVNAQDATLNVQAAIKNLASNTVFYFVIPVALDCLYVAAEAPMEVAKLVRDWKGMDESSEAAVVVNGQLPPSAGFET